MFSDYQFPGMAFHSTQWPEVGATSPTSSAEEFISSAERRDLLLTPVIR